MTGWALIGGLGAATLVLKMAGPVTAGALRLPRWLVLLLPYVTPAVLAGLVVTATFAAEDSLVIDARAAGLGTAVVTIALRAPVLVVVVAAALVTGVVRAV